MDCEYGINIVMLTKGDLWINPLDVYSETKSVIVFGKQFSASLFEINTNVPYTLIIRGRVGCTQNRSYRKWQKI